MAMPAAEATADAMVEGCQTGSPIFVPGVLVLSHRREPPRSGAANDEA
jgi:hypothetical protein